MPIGFESDGTPFGIKLKCAAPPSNSLPHPTGFNCFLLALRSGDHGASGADLSSEEGHMPIGSGHF